MSETDTGVARFSWRETTLILNMIAFIILELPDEFACA